MLVSTAFAQTPPAAQEQPAATATPATTAQPANAAQPAAPEAKPAPAAPPSEATKKAARQAYSDGQKAFDAGNFAEAETQFSKANELIKSANASYWIAICRDMQGKSAEAYAAFQALFADPSSASLSEDKLAKAREKMDALAKAPVDVTITMIPASAMVSVDGTPQLSTSPLVLKLAPGEHKVSVGAAGYDTMEREVTINPGEKAAQSFELTKTPAPPPVVAAPTPAPAPAPPKTTATNKLPAYITLGVAGASAIVGTIFGVQALKKKNDFNKKPTSATADAVERNALIADMSFGVTITLGITGVVLLTSDDASEIARAGEPGRAPEQASLSVTPYVSPKGGGASALLKF